MAGKRSVASMRVDARLKVRRNSCCFGLCWPFRNIFGWYRAFSTKKCYCGALGAAVMKGFKKIGAPRYDFCFFSLWPKSQSLMAATQRSGTNFVSTFKPSPLSYPDQTWTDWPLSKTFSFPPGPFHHLQLSPLRPHLQTHSYTAALLLTIYVSSASPHQNTSTWGLFKTFASSCNSCMSGRKQNQSLECGPSLHKSCCLLNFVVAPDSLVSFVYLELIIFLLKATESFTIDIMKNFSIDYIKSYRFLISSLNLIKYNSTKMIKNRTLQFKQKYSTSQPKHPPPRTVTPQYLKKKFLTTGFTDFSITTSAKQPSKRKLAKVESSAFINSRKKLSEFCLQDETYSRKYLDNSTSLCQFLDNAEKKIEKPLMSRFRMTTNDDWASQNAIIESQKLNRFQANKPQNQIIIRAISNTEQFFKSLTPRSLFFCSKCFKYIFAIEKNLHHPNCENQIHINQLKTQQIQQLGWQRLYLIKQLAEYTNFKHAEVLQLYQKLKQKKLRENVVIEPGVDYIAFEQIVQAFYFVWHLLISKENIKNSGIFSMKKIFSCVEAQQASGLYEKKYFK